MIFIIRSSLVTLGLLLSFNLFAGSNTQHQPGLIARLVSKIESSLAKKAVRSVWSYITSAAGVQDMVTAGALAGIVAVAHNVGHATADSFLLNNSNSVESYDALHAFNSTQGYTHVPPSNQPAAIKQIGVDLAGPLTGASVATLAFWQLRKHEGMYITKLASIAAMIGSLVMSYSTRHDYAHALGHVKSILVNS